MLSKIEEILTAQINVASDLLQRAIEIPDGQKSYNMYGFIKYDENHTRPIADDLNGWEMETLEILRTLYGEESRQQSDFQKKTRNKNHYMRFREEAQSEIRDCKAFLEALIKAEQIKQGLQAHAKSSESSKSPMIFISHSSQDKEFVTDLVNLLEDIGMTADNLFCSSVPEYGVRLGKDIFDTLRQLFHDHELYMIFVHSPRYYNSTVSLNEMGAAWVLRTKCISILTADMEFNKMNGVINGDDISIKVNQEDATARLNELKDCLIDAFNLPSIEHTKWERKRDSFIKKVTALGQDGKMPSIPSKEQDSIDNEYKRLQIERMKYEAEVRKKAVIRGNIIRNSKPGQYALTIINAGQSEARNVRIEWLNKSDKIYLTSDFSDLGNLSPQNNRKFHIILCEGAPDIMHLRYYWEDGYSDNNVVEEQIQF